MGRCRENRVLQVPHQNNWQGMVAQASGGHGSNISISDSDGSPFSSRHDAHASQKQTTRFLLRRRFSILPSRHSAPHPRYTPTA